MKAFCEAVGTIVTMAAIFVSAIALVATIADAAGMP